MVWSELNCFLLFSSLIFSSTMVYPSLSLYIYWFPSLTNSKPIGQLLLWTSMQALVITHQLSLLRAYCENSGWWPKSDWTKTIWSSVALKYGAGHFEYGPIISFDPTRDFVASYRDCCGKLSHCCEHFGQVFKLQALALPLVLIFHSKLLITCWRLRAITKCFGGSWIFWSYGSEHFISIQYIWSFLIYVIIGL